METHKKSNNFLIQGSILAIASLISRIIGMLYRIPLTNIVGDEGMGYYGVAYHIYSIALILSSYSIPLAVSKLVAAREMKKEYRNSYRIFLCSMCFAGLIGLITSFIVYFGADFFAALLKYERSAIPLKILAPTIFVFAVMGVLRGYYQGKNTMLPTSISQIIEQVINAIVSVIAAYYLMKTHSASPDIAAYGAAGGTFGTLIGACVSLAFLVFIFIIFKPFVNKQIRRDRGSVRESYRDIFKLLLITIIPVVLSQTVYQLSATVDSALFGQIMAGKGVNLETRSALYGIYSNKYKQLTDLPVSIASAMSVAIIPSIISSITGGSTMEVNKKVHQAVKFNMIIAIPSAVGLAVLAKPILDLLYTGNTELPARLLQIGSVAVILFALSTTTNAILQGINKLHVPVINSAISLAIHIIIVIILLQLDLGTYALVIGNVTFVLLICILNWISIAKYLNYNQEIIKTFLIPGASSIIMGIVSFLLYFLLYKLTEIVAISLGITIVVAVILYLTLLLLFKGITREELMNMPKGNTLVHIAVKLRLLR